MRARKTTLAVCDQEAFYPFRSLVEGGISGYSDLAEAERFVRAVILHDKITMELEPWPYDRDSDPGFAEEEKIVGARSVIVAIGPTLDGFDFFSDEDLDEQSRGTELSNELVTAAHEFSRDQAGEPYYNAHVTYLQRLVWAVESGGTALVSGDFGRTAIERTAEYPQKLFEQLDESWQEFARRAGDGDVGLVAPPFLSVLLTRAARRDAIPQVLTDMRDEFAAARRKLWRLLDELKYARTLGEAQKIKTELENASRNMLPGAPAQSAARVLWSLVGNSVGGAVTAALSHGDPLVGAAIGAAKAVGGSLPLEASLGRSLFGRGAFDLARRVRRETLGIERDALRRHLSAQELRRLR